MVTENDFRELIGKLSENIVELAGHISGTDDLIERLGDKAEVAYNYLDMVNSQIETAIKAAKVGFIGAVIGKLKGFLHKEKN